MAKAKAASARIECEDFRKRLLLLVGASFFLLAMKVAIMPARAEPSVFPTGTTIYDPARAYNSFVLFSGGDDVSRLIDLTGKVVHEWKYTGQPVAFIDPALVDGKRGHVFVTLESEEGKGTDLVPGPRADAHPQDSRRSRLERRQALGVRPQCAGRPRAAASRHRPPAQRQYAGSRQYLLSAAGLRRAAGARRRRL